MKYKSIFKFGVLRIEFWAEFSRLDLSLIAILVGGFGEKGGKIPILILKNQMLLCRKRAAVF